MVDLAVEGKSPPQGTEKRRSSDFWNVALLIVLYTLQGIPMGLSGSIPYLMQGRALRPSLALEMAGDALGVRSPSASFTRRGSGFPPTFSLESKSGEISDTDATPLPLGELGDQGLSGILESYRLLLRLVALRPVQMISLALLVVRLPFGATDVVTPLKLVEYGLPKEKLAFLAPFLVPIGIASPIFISRLMNYHPPLRLFVWGFATRCALTLVWTFSLPLTRAVMAEGGSDPPMWYLGTLFTLTAFYSILSDVMFVSQIGFFAKIADPTIGGTYMTLLNTVANIGNKWPGTAALMCVDFVTQRECPAVTASSVCPVVSEGYYRIVAACFGAGAILWFFGRSRLLDLESLPSRAWKVDSRPPKPKPNASPLTSGT